MPDATPDAAPDAGPDAAPDAMPDAGPPDAAPDAQIIMSITAILPPAASRAVDTPLTITGLNLEMGAKLVLHNCDTDTEYDLTTSVVVATDGTSLTALLAADPQREQGLYTVMVTNPNGQSDILACAFSILAQAPPTVVSVTPTTAYQGKAGDGTQSDTLVTLVGTGFLSTPSVTWVRTDGVAATRYEALVVGFVSDTQITAVVPSETLHMEAGLYHVFVTNPDLLGAQWLLPDKTAGVFTITAAPPPYIDDVDPVRVEIGSCSAKTVTLKGKAFHKDATAWHLAASGTTCVNQVLDANGNILCPLKKGVVAEDGTSITVNFDPCPGTGVYPVAVQNPDGQIDYYFSVAITPSSDGHLNTVDFEVLTSTLVRPRWKHASTFGFDAFSHSYLYVAAGQDKNGAVLDSVETSQLSIFGVPGPFFEGQQYLNPQTLRAPNTLVKARQGASLVRVGRELYLLGGAAAATDVADTVPALREVEHAHILGFDEVPGVRQPTAMLAGNLPVGSWYYQVSSIGSWGESLPTREVLARNVGGTVHLCWDPPGEKGVTGYNVYRSLASDGRANRAAVVAVNVAPANAGATCIDDNGAEGFTPAPGRTRGSVTGGTKLSVGTYSYRVSAVYKDSGGGDKETYAGYATAIELLQTDLDAQHAAVKLTWDAVPGAIAYRVYRLDSVSATYLRLDTLAPVVTPTFTDDGAAFEGTPASPKVEISPLLPGSLSLWQELNAERFLKSPREGLDAVVIHLEPKTSGGQVARILAAGGRTTNTGAADTYLTSAESIGILEDGSLEMEWTQETPKFTHARVFFALNTTQGRNETPFPPEPEEPPCGDFDGDGYIDCTCAPPGTPECDCVDTDATIHPHAEDLCGDGIDQDCDKIDPPCMCTTDMDMDMHFIPDCGGADCCDSGTETSLGCKAATAMSIHPGATDICGDGIDQDCDKIDPACPGCTDDLDGDKHISEACGGDDCCDTGAGTSYGCTDLTASIIYPGQEEVCNDGVDQNCDGLETICSMTRPSPIANLIGGEPVYVIASFGDDLYEVTNNEGQKDFEACGIDPVTGLLSCGTSWVLQGPTDSHATFGHDAVLYFDFLFPFYGVNRETTAAPTTRTFHSAAIGRYDVADPAGVAGNLVLSGTQSASVTFKILRSYYQMTRLVSYLYVIGGWAEQHTEGTVVVPEGPTGTVERHQQ
jgi:hypothetical protein